MATGHLATDGILRLTADPMIVGFKVVYQA